MRIFKKRWFWGGGGGVCRDAILEFVSIRMEQMLLDG